MIPFPPSLSVPPAIPFPRSLFEPALQGHARLLDDSLGDLMALLLEGADRGDGLPFTTGCAAKVEYANGNSQLSVQNAASLVDEVALYRGIRRGLMAPPEEGLIHVVTVAGSVIALHLLRMRPPVKGDGGTSAVLEIVTRDLAFEPREQEHREIRDWTVTRWVPRGSEPRWSWVPTPRAPSTREELVDRLMAANDMRIRTRLWEQPDRGPKREVLVWLKVSMREGDSVSVANRVHSDSLPFVTGRAPAIQAILAQQHRADVVPVYVTLSDFAALRWLDLRADRQGAHGLPSLIEDFEVDDMEISAADLAQFEAWDRELGPLPPPDEERPPMTSPGPKSFDVMTGVHWLAASDLVELGDAELDGLIAKAGFDPAVERGDGHTLREAVLSEVGALVNDEHLARGADRMPTAPDPGKVGDSSTEGSMGGVSSKS